MLRDRAEVHKVALSDADLIRPAFGMLLDLAGSLKRSHFQFRNIKTYDVEAVLRPEGALVGCFRKDGLFTGVPASFAVGAVSPFGPRMRR